MKKPLAALWTFVLLLCLSLITFLIVGLRQPGVPTPAPPTASAPPLSLVIAPTRFLPTVAAGEQSTHIPTIAPITLIAPTATPRIFQLNQSLPSEFTLSRFCHELGLPVSLRIFDWQTSSTVSLNDSAVAQLPLSWDASDNLWQGYYSPLPFNQPRDVLVRWKITLFLSDSTERWVEIFVSPTTPWINYIYAFEATTAFADKNGDHFGYHPCRAFALPAEQVDAFMTAVAQYQDVVRYPALISSKDPRWTRGVVRPVAAYADLRSIPSVNYNVPIGGISREEHIWYAIDPMWGPWAQLKLGAVQGWVDTTLVTLAPEQ